MREKEQIEILGKLGEGAYGCVYKAYMFRTGDYVAVKTITIADQDEGIPSSTLRQIAILKNLNHPTIVRLLNYQIDFEQLKIQLIFEYVDSDLFKYMRSFKQYIPQPLIRKIVSQILMGLNYLHENKVFHRDLKPQNILIDRTGNIKIADFGLGRIIRFIIQTMSKEIETLWYRAPELLMGATRYSFAVDVWSLGCIFYELAEGKVLFKTDSEIGQIMEIMRQCGTPHMSEWQFITQLPYFSPSFPKFSKIQRKYMNLSPEGVDLLEKMIVINPERRVTVQDALQHPYFRTE